MTDQQATGTLTVPPPLPTPGQTVTIGGTTYTFAAAITAQSAADTVLIGTDVQSTLANLAGAINLSIHEWAGGWHDLLLRHRRRQRLGHSHGFYGHRAHPAST